MLKTLALTTCLGLILSTPSLSETYTDPDAAWWGAFLETHDGTAPDLESLALQDPEYLAADEFSRDEALVRVMARLAADRDTIDLTSLGIPLDLAGNLGTGTLPAGSIGWTAAGGATTVYVNTGTAAETLAQANMKILLLGNVALAQANFLHG